MRLIASVSGILLLVSPLACKKDTKKADGEAGKTAEEPTTPPEPPEQPEKPAEPPAAEGPDVPMESHVGLNVGDIEWTDGPNSLPKGAQIAVLEGEPPFPANKTFTIALKFPKKYTIPPHTHLVTERVTVLQGALHFGHGEKLDKKSAKKITEGGLILIPADHTHFAYTEKEEAIITLQGVGPWGIFYVDPKDDPRPEPPAKPESVDAKFESEVEASMTLPKEAKFAPTPQGLMPPGAELAVREGTPPFSDQKTATVWLKLPDGYKIPPHSHPTTERITVLKGTLGFAMGDSFNEADLVDMKIGAVGILPTGMNHYVQAKGETIVQVMFVGPFAFKWVNPDDDPAKGAGPQ